MTLRVRLALWFGVVVALGVGAASVLAYVDTASELEAETDDFLEVRAREFTDGVRALPNNDGRNGRDGRRGGGDADIDEGDIAELFGSDPDSVLQSLDQDGTVVSGGPLPVDEIDRKLASSDGPPKLRDITSTVSTTA